MAASIRVITRPYDSCGIHRFNPLAPTLMTKALQALLERLSVDGMEKHLSRDVLEMVVETANGDIRSVSMALQFAIAPLYVI